MSVESVPDVPRMLWGGLGALALLLALAWRRGARTAGLPLCYVLSLATIHFAGAWVSILPDGPSDHSAIVALGFRECFGGILAFTAGVLLFELFVVGTRAAEKNPSPAYAHRSPPARTMPGPAQPMKAHARADPAMATGVRRLGSRVIAAYILLGIAFAVTAPLVSSVPSVAALAHRGSYLVVAGFCLGCFRAGQIGGNVAILTWIAGTCAFPIFTILTAGFIGYGVFAAMMVLSFALVFYRPRWQAVAGLAAVAYLGLSAYVTYMRDRDEMRETVWGGQTYAVRWEKLRAIFIQFEFFRPGNERQLQAIDDRLNQNYLMGLACIHLESGLVPWAHGRTLWRAVLAVVPRIVWPEKPVVAGSGQLVSEYTGLVFAEGTSVGIGPVMEFFVNFGRAGVIIGFCCLGVALRLFDWQAARCLHRADPAGFVLWYLPGLSFLQTEGSLVEVLGTCAASLALALALNRFGLPWMVQWLGGAPDRRHPVPPRVIRHKPRTL